MGRIARAVSIPLLLAELLTACSESVPVTPSPIPRSPIPTSGTVIASGCTLPDVYGVVSERTPDGIQPISAAIVELFFGASRDSDNAFKLDAVEETLTNAAGHYSICLPPPPDGTGGTGPTGQQFEVRVRKDGYRTASQSFTFAYSVWDYGEVEVSLELVRN
jgi:hypothetical protein